MATSRRPSPKTKGGAKSAVKRVGRREQLRQQRQEQQQKREQGMRKTIWARKLPTGCSIFKVNFKQEKKHLMDIICYAAGSNDPIFPKGEVRDTLELQIHKNIGPNKDEFVCPGNWGDPCPCCEKKERLVLRDADWNRDIKQYATSTVNIYNIEDLTSAESASKGIQIAKFARGYMQEALEEAADSAARPGEAPREWADWDRKEGASIAFKVIPKASDNDYPKLKGHTFVTRDYDIPVEKEEAAWPLDECIHRPTYEEVWEAMYQMPFDKAKSDAMKADTTEDSRGRTLSDRRTAESRLPSDEEMDEEYPESGEEEEAGEEVVDDEEESGEEEEAGEEVVDDEEEFGEEEEAGDEEAGDEVSIEDVVSVLSGMDRKTLKEVRDQFGLEVVFSKSRTDEEAREMIASQIEEKEIIDDFWAAYYITDEEEVCEEEEAEEEEVETPPAPKKAAAKKAAPKKAAAKKAAKKTASAGECPNGYRFGIDADSKPECESDCPEAVWEKCFAKLQESK